MNPIPVEQENPNGLHQRYEIYKSSGEPVDPNAEYFVLRLDLGGNDPKHIQACRQAIRTYAVAIQDHLPVLANDLLARYPD